MTWFRIGVVLWLVLPMAALAESNVYVVGRNTPNVSRIANGSSALGTSSIASTACATVVTGTATGTLTTDSIQWTPNADISAVTGYAPVTTGALIVYVYPTADTVNFKVCNPTALAIVPGAVTINWRVIR